MSDSKELINGDLPKHNWLRRWVEDKAEEHGTDNNDCIDCQLIKSIRYILSDRDSLTSENERLEKELSVSEEALKAMADFIVNKN